MMKLAMKYIALLCITSIFGCGKEANDEKLVFALPGKALLQNVLIPAKVGDKYGYVNEYKRLVLPAVFDEALSF